MAKRVVIMIIDGSNFYWMQRNLNCRIDQDKFCQLISASYGEIVAKIFIRDLTPNGDNTYHEKLRELGFIIKDAPLKPYNNEKPNGKTFKSRSDQILTIEVAKMLWKDKLDFDVLILVSGDSDFEFIINECKEKGKEVVIWAIRACLANEIVQVATSFNLFEDHPNLRLY